MSGKDVNDYLTEGMYGVRRPKEKERLKYLGTLRERIVIALTTGEVMTDSGIEALDIAMKEHPDTKLIINGQVSHRFLNREKELADKHGISYTFISNENVQTHIGAVLTYDHAVNIEHIFIKDMKEDEPPEEQEPQTHEKRSFFDKIKSWFQ